MLISKTHIKSTQQKHTTKPYILNNIIKNIFKYIKYMSNPSIPVMTYVDIPNYNTLKSNAKIVSKASDNINVPKYEATISEYQQGLQYDQTIGRSMLMKERQAAMTVADYKTGHFISNDPHDSELRKHLIDTLKFTLPKIIYECVIEDARTLPKIEFLEELVSSYYSRIVINNLMNIYNNSPNFYYSTTSSEINFKLYERFIYLLTFIEIVLEHKNQEDFMEKDNNMIDVVEWCLNRKLQDINYLLKGPETNQKYDVPYSQIYYSLISPSTDNCSVTQYLTLATLQEVGANILKYRDEFVKHPNVYDKNPNYAQSYTISIDTRSNAYFKKDNVGNLVVDCSNIDLGNSTNDNINLDINEALVNTENLKYEPKSQAIKFGNILRQFSIFRVKSLLVLKTTYKMALNTYDTCYLVFPSITLDGRFNQIYKNGALQVAGKFQENNNNKYWEFVPYNDVAYVSKTANVKRFEFYISPKPGTNYKPNPNNFKIASEINKYYNIAIRVHSVEELNNTPLAPNADFLPETYIIRNYKISKRTGSPEETEYTFLYNKTFKTIQALPSKYNINTVPKFGVNKTAKSIKIDIGMQKPVYPPTANPTILDAVSVAISEGKTTFRLPRVVPLTNLNAVEYLMVQAINKNETTIKFETNISTHKFLIPELIKNNSGSVDKSVVFENFMKSILKTLDKTFDNEDDYKKFKDEIINKINDALVNKKDFIYVVEVKDYEEFDFGKFNLNSNKFLKYINSKEYDFKEALVIMFNPIEQIFTIDYINKKIKEAVDDKSDKVYVNGDSFNYFGLYLEDGETVGVEELMNDDVVKMFDAMSVNKDVFKSDLFGDIYIKRYEAEMICRSIKKVSEKFVDEEIYNNRNDNNIKRLIKFVGSDEFVAYNLYKKEYVKNDEFNYYLNNLMTEFKIDGVEYFVEYLFDEIKDKVYKDINGLQSGVINVDGKDYNYVYFNNEDKEYVFKALREGLNYFVKDGVRYNINLKTKDIAIATAKVWFINKNVEVYDDVSVEEYGKGYKMIGDDKYYIFLNTKKITEDLNNMVDVEYTDEDIINDCNDALNSAGDKIHGTKFINIYYHDVQMVLDEIAANPEARYEKLKGDGSYTLQSGQSVKVYVEDVFKIRYNIALSSGRILKYAEGIEGRLSDEYINAMNVYDNYVKDDHTNLIDTTIDLPNILETDTYEEIYKKWLNYYLRYGLFIPDFNYVIKYTTLKSEEVNVYDNDFKIVSEKYNLYDWLIGVYDVDVTKEDVIYRVMKRVEVIKINDLYFENIVFKDGVELKYYKIVDDEYYVYDRGDSVFKRMLMTRHNNYFTFSVSDVEKNVVNIILPSNMKVNKKAYKVPTVEDDYYSFMAGVDSSIVYNSVKINGKSLEELNYNYVENNGRIETLGTYSDNVTDENINDIEINANNFSEYQTNLNENVPEVFNIEYVIRKVRKNPDSSETTFESYETVEYPNNINVLKDMDGRVKTHLVCYRDFNIADNIYKTFIIDADLTDKTIFSTNNWLYSMKKMMYSNSKTSPYIDVNDLGLHMLTGGNKNFDELEYMQPVLIKYFVQWINNYSYGLIVECNDYGFSGISAYIDGEEYKLQDITDNLFGLDYYKVVDKGFEVISSGSRFKMILQLL